MSFGVQVTNDSNIVMIDDTLSNYSVYATGSVASGGGVTIPNIPGALLFVNPVGDLVTIVSGGLPGSVAYFDASINAIPYIIAVPSSFFSLASVNTGYGFNVYKPNGAVSFSSVLSSMAVVSMPAILANTNSTIITVGSSTKTRYFCANPCSAMGLIYAYDESNYFYGGNLYLRGGKDDNNTFVFEAYDYNYYLSQFSGGSLSGILIGSNQYRHIIIMEI